MLALPSQASVENQEVELTGRSKIASESSKPNKGETTLASHNVSMAPIKVVRQNKKQKSLPP